MLKDETINRVLKFRDDRDWRQFHTPKDLAISMNLEAAELLEIFQWSGGEVWGPGGTGGRPEGAGGGVPGDPPPPPLSARGYRRRERT